MEQQMSKETKVEKEKSIKEDITVIKLAKIAEWLCSLDMNKPLDEADFVASRVSAGYLLSLSQELKIDQRSSISSMIGRFNNKDIEV